MMNPRFAKRLRQVTILALVGYWIALFVGTHLPVTQVHIKGNDKLLHYAAYSGLALLLTLVLNWRAKGGLRLGHCLLVIFGLAVFGGFDELTQPWVNRQADWLDWFADLAGIVTGTLIGAALSRLGCSKEIAEPIHDLPPVETHV